MLDEVARLGADLSTRARPRADRRPRDVGRPVAPRPHGRRPAPPPARPWTPAGAATSSRSSPAPSCGAFEPRARLAPRASTTTNGSRACSTAGRRRPATAAVEGGLRFDGAQVIPIEPRAGTGILRDQAQRGARAHARRAPTATWSPCRSARSTRRSIRPPSTTAAARARALLARRRHARDRHRRRSGSRPRSSRPRWARGRRARARARPSTPTSCTPRSAPALAPLEHAARRRDVRGHRAEHRQRRAVPRRARSSTWSRGSARSCAATGGSRAPLEAKHPAHDTAVGPGRSGITRQVSSFTTEYPAGEPRVTTSTAPPTSSTTRSSNPGKSSRSTTSSGRARRRRAS